MKRSYLFASVLAGLTALVGVDAVKAQVPVVTYYAPTTVYYPTPTTVTVASPVVTPAPTLVQTPAPTVVTSPVPTVVTTPAPVVTYYRAPTMYYRPPVAVTRYRPILGGTVTRYVGGYAPVVVY
jgi:hypothetical protein